MIERFPQDGSLAVYHAVALATDDSLARARKDGITLGVSQIPPEEIVDADYRLQRLVYALACFRAGAEDVEVVYQFLERPAEPVEARHQRGLQAVQDKRTVELR